MNSFVFIDCIGFLVFNKIMLLCTMVDLCYIHTASGLCPFIFFSKSLLHYCKHVKNQIQAKKQIQPTRAISVDVAGEKNALLEFPSRLLFLAKDFHFALLAASVPCKLQVTSFIVH